MHDGVNQSCLGAIQIFARIRKTFSRIFPILIIWALFAGCPAAAVDDDYLKALESEADDTGSMAKKPLNSSPTTANPAGANSGVNNNEKESFEKLLEFELPSTYKFYTKLNAQDQAKVITHYNQEKKMSAASKIIFDLYFQRNK